MLVEAPEGAPAGVLVEVPEGVQEEALAGVPEVVPEGALVEALATPLPTSPRP